MSKILLRQLKCFDNGGETADRYTVILNARGDYVGMSDNPFHPQGIGQHGEGCLPGAHLGKRIDFDNLPDDCKKLVRRDLLDSVSGDKPGSGVAIVDKDGDVVRTSRNLSCIMAHAREFGVASPAATLEQDGYRLLVGYPNGDHCQTMFSDPVVLSEFIANRVRFGRGKFAAATAPDDAPLPQPGQ